MKLNPKVTGALAWTGLVLVLAVPAADMLGGKPEAAIRLTSDTDQLQTASVPPAAANPVPKPVAVRPTTPQIADVPTAAVANDPVEAFIKSGKTLPSYISGADTPETAALKPETAAVKPGTITVNPDGTISRPPVVPAAPAAGSESVATIQPQLVAPVPLPASARPRSRPLATPLPDALPATAAAPLIIEEDQSVALRGAVEPLLDPEPLPIVRGDELEEWDTGSLAEYLRRKGLMENASRASVRTDSDYDPDGFFLDEGPNADRRSRVIIIDRDRGYY